MQDVELICSSSGSHIAQIYSGFAMLAEHGRVRVRLTRTESYDPGPAGSILRAVVDGQRIVYDTRDHASCPPEDLEWADHYFKRSFDSRAASVTARPSIMRPLGLNYLSYTRGDWWLRRCVWTVERTRPRNGRAALTQLALLTPGLSSLTNGGRSNCMYQRFESPPEMEGNTVLMLTRTWDPRRASGERAQMRADMNSTRTKAIRLLRSELGPRFVGGLHPTEDARRDYPDLVVDGAITRKSRYVELMRRSAVCIPSQGLLGTHGWRLAEYVAASRPIVTEPLQHEVPGDFREGQNYLTYASSEGLLVSVQRLLDNPDLSAAMRHANHHYYSHHVRPDAIVAHTLSQVFGGRPC